MRLGELHAHVKDNSKPDEGYHHAGDVVLHRHIDHGGSHNTFTTSEQSQNILCMKLFNLANW